MTDKILNTYLRKIFDNTDESIEFIVKYINPQVEIITSTETGQLLYAVQIVNTDFWLCAFDTAIEAKYYIDKYRLTEIKSS